MKNIDIGVNVNQIKRETKLYINHRHQCVRIQYRSIVVF